MPPRPWCSAPRPRCWSSSSSSLRLLAPYLGLTLETSTFVIGTALAAIALGSWIGRSGRRPDPAAPAARRRCSASPASRWRLTPFARPRGRRAATDGRRCCSWSRRSAIIVPGALLAAVTPMVTKLRLTSLDETGTVVGRLSGIGTVGRHRRHGGHRVRADLPGAGQRDPGRARGAARGGRRGRSRWRVRGRRAAAVPAAVVLVGGRDRRGARRAAATSRPPTTAPCRAPTRRERPGAPWCWTGCATPTSTSTTRRTWSSPTPARSSPRSTRATRAGPSRCGPTTSAAAG